ncbi:putative ankyrin repeat-containing domain-containing protein [Helianthus annuus]|uniref:Ankyrin repeat-containing domain-containing protein n=1 Tax=Helianthus annuus TaxID=4232 RepID=A0A9K3HC12_HELAN|nr:E3 ubiquitin-protein ligase XBAT33-like [Helianthus annuus]KAF5775287.1 putative ankyrin repeat-containing domain-containing protein [Helianthus annuus]
MGNSFGCSASGERLVSTARDGDFIEAKMLLDCNPCIAKYSTFGGLNCPLHFAAAKGHNDIVALLLDNGADVNSRNYCGQVIILRFRNRHGHPILASKICSPKFRAILCSSSINPKVRLIA